MKALAKTGPNPGLELIEAPIPTVGPDDVLIRVHQASICGTDLHIDAWDAWAQNTVAAPQILGHEFMGTVTEIGTDVDFVNQGQRVSVEGHIPCQQCRNCRAGRRAFCNRHQSVGVTRDGAFAEYVAVPASNLFDVPDHIDDDTATVLDPLGNATHTALSFDLVGEDVLVTGAGPTGLMSAAIAKQVGARFVVVSDVNPYRLKLAKEVGADEVVDVRETTPAEIMETLGMTEGFDVGLEMSGHESAINQMLEAMNNGGGIGLLGIPPEHVTLDLNSVIFKGLTVRGIYGRKIFETWYKMAAMLQSGLDISPVITHRFSIDDHAAAFDLVRSGQCGKVLLDINPTR